MYQIIYRREPNLAQNLFWFNPLFSNKTGKVVMDKLLANFSEMTCVGHNLKWAQNTLCAKLGSLWYLFSDWLKFSKQIINFCEHNLMKNCMFVKIYKTPIHLMTFRWPKNPKNSPP